MANDPSIKIGGLWRNGNPLDAPEGSLSEALNVWHPARNALEPRRGFQEQISLAFGNKALAMAAYEDRLVFLRRGAGSNKINVTNAAKAGGEDTNVLSGLTEVSSLVTPKTALAGKNLYLNALEGTYRMSGSAAVPVPAGAPKATGFVSATVTGTSGWLAAGKSTAYRAVFVTMDSFGRLYLGSPSGRIIASNKEASSRNVEVDVLVPSWTTTDAFLRVYRTSETDTNIDPGDEMALIHEVRVTESMLVDGHYTFVDLTSSEIRGATLYTNPNSGQGILQANEPPPASVDLTNWNNRLWFLNTTRLHSLPLELLGVGGGGSSAANVSGLRNLDTITINGTTYEARDGEQSPQDAYFDSAPTSASAADNIRNVAKNLVDAINRGPDSHNIRAFYMSGPDDAPGKILVEAANTSVGKFYATANTGTLPIASLSHPANSGFVTATIDGVYSESNPFSVGDSVSINFTGTSTHFVRGTYTVTSVIGTDKFVYNDGNFTTRAAATETTATLKVTTARRLDLAGSAWSPALPVSGTRVGSDNEAAPNRLYYSKLDEFEAVPRLNYMDIGDPTAKGLRIKALRDRLYVFKEDGVFVVSGEAPFRVDLFDPTARLVFPDSLDVVDNQIYGAFDLGICSVSEGGVRVVSGSIQDVIDSEYRGIVRAGSTSPAAFGAGDSVEHRYVIWLPSGDAYVYNTRLNLWTQWALAADTAYADKSTGALWIASGTSVSREGDPTDRRSYMDTKMSQYVLTPYLFEGRYYLLSPLFRNTYIDRLGTQAASDLLGLKPDSYVYDKGTNRFMRVEGYADGVNHPSNPYLAVPVAIEAEPIVGATRRPIAQNIPVVVTWLPSHQGAPDQAKQFREVRYSFQDVPPVYRHNKDYGSNTTIREPKVTFTSDVTHTTTEIPFITEEVGTSYFPFYPQNTSARARRIPQVHCAQVPQDHAFSTFLETGFSFAMPLCYWRLVGRSLIFEKGADYP